MDALITLTDDDMLECLAYAKRRFDEGRKLGKSPHRIEGEDKRNGGIDPYEIGGVAGELAVIRYFDSSAKPGINTFTSIGDVHGYEVKTALDHGKRLIYRPPEVGGRDDPARTYILVTTEHWKGKPGLFWLRGWIVGIDARLRGSLEDPNERGRPAFFVSPSQLNPMSTLPNPCNGKDFRGVAKIHALPIPSLAGIPLIPLTSQHLAALRR